MNEEMGYDVTKLFSIEKLCYIANVTCRNGQIDFDYQSIDVVVPSDEYKEIIRLQRAREILEEQRKALKNKYPYASDAALDELKSEFKTLSGHVFKPEDVRLSDMWLEE